MSDMNIRQAVNAQIMEASRHLLEAHRKIQAAAELESDAGYRADLIDLAKEIFECRKSARCFAKD